MNNENPIVNSTIIHNYLSNQSLGHSGTRAAHWWLVHCSIPASASAHLWSMCRECDALEVRTYKPTTSKMQSSSYDQGCQFVGISPNSEEYQEFLKWADILWGEPWCRENANICTIWELTLIKRAFIDYPTTLKSIYTFGGKFHRSVFLCSTIAFISKQ